MGDWIDEYCDLTLDKMVNECANVNRRNITHAINTPADIQELKKQLGQLELNDKNNTFVISSVQDRKQTFFDKIKTFFNRKV